MEGLISSLISSTQADNKFSHATPLPYHLGSNKALEGEPTCTASLGGIGARKTCHLSILCTFHGKQRNTDDVLIKAVQIDLE